MNNNAIFQSRILVIDDEPANVELLEQLLHREGFNNVISTTESERALAIFHAFKPDLILLDLRMPKIDGFSLLTSLAEFRSAQVFLPVIVLTADVTRETKHKALAMGATDFLTKPFDTIEVMLRIWNLLETTLLHKQLLELNPNTPPLMSRPKLS
ncbi:MAG: response regulator [Moraxellaceae bacterium]|jgi:DNA-binding response OmpR family regulator|nr:response regulator [Moraxellaceae bacterium]MDZ4387556.1 response regulator [Moraxellaceae bacterium]